MWSPRSPGGCRGAGEELADKGSGGVGGGPWWARALPVPCVCHPPDGWQASSAGRVRPVLWGRLEPFAVCHRGPSCYGKPAPTPSPLVVCFLFQEWDFWVNIGNSYESFSVVRDVHSRSEVPSTGGDEHLAGCVEECGHGRA